MPVDLNISGTLDLDTSTFSDASGSATTLPSYLVDAPPNGTSIRVFVVKHLTVGDLLITSTTATQNANGVGPAVAFLATNDVVVNGRVVVDSGAVAIPGCVGSPGGSVSTYRGGGGGGAFSGPGYNGGDAPSGANGGAPGTSLVGPELVPLRGGCPGAGTNIAGGAIQIVSITKIDVMGTITADGHGATTRSGGGAGGGILLEAPTVTLGPMARLLTRGGGGGAGGGSTANAPSAPDDASSPPGGTCTPVGANCGGGGGGESNSAGHPGGNATATGVLSSAGGGGGAFGLIRVNTADGTLNASPGSIVAGSATTGTLGTI